MRKQKRGFERMLRSVFRVGLALILCGTLLTACGTEPSSDGTVTQNVTGTLTVTAFAVGKADAIVLRTTNGTVVLDCGYKGDGKRIEQFLTAQGVQTIDTLIVTHFDEDHVGGAARLVNRMPIGQIYLPDYPSNGEAYREFVQKMKEQSLTPNHLSAAESVTWTLDDCVMRLDAAEQTDYGKNEENDFSLSLFVQHGENSFLFAGDAEKARQKELMTQVPSPVTFLKMPYHGRFLSTTEEFLDTFAPKVAVICCSKEDDADEQTRKALAAHGSAAYFTSDGDVTVCSDGHTLTVT